MNADDFLAPILVAPGDDVPRLIFADWLDERGDPRGEFIRVQCELAKLDERDPRVADLEFRERSLLARHRNAWAKPLRKFGRSLVFRRGFVDELTLPAKTFLEQGEVVFALAPLQRMKLVQVPAHVEALANCPLLARLAWLNLRDGKLGLNRLKTFLKSPWLEGLTGIDFSYNGLSTSGLREIVGYETLKQVKMLGLDSCGVTGEGLDLLLDSELLAGVEELHLRSNGLQPADAQRLAESSALSQLRMLILDFNTQLGEAGLRALLGSKHLSSLRQFSLRDCRLGSETMAAFHAVGPSLNLTRLNLCKNFFGDEGARTLAQSGCLRELVELELHINLLGTQGFEALITEGGMRQLRTLRTSASDLKRSAVEVLCDWDGAKLLTSLDLSNCPIDNPAAARLAQAENLSLLNVLDLSWTNMGDKGARALVESTTLNRLTELRLSTKPQPEAWRNSPGISEDVKKQLVSRFGKHVCRFD